MNITVKVDEITLSTIVADTVAFDEDGDTYSTGQQTVAHLVAAQIAERLVKDDRYPGLRDQVMEIRKEEIRAAVRPSIDEALARPIYKTNTYGERTGQETTLAELVADEARKQLTEPADRYRNEKGSILQQAVRSEVQKAFQSEIAEAVQKTRDLVIAELGGDIAQQITKAVTVGLTKRT
ncbi:hypothetical protein ABZ438_07740 [Streptomyces sp. NPDC005786]|uniref:hypothetical protein n=1 Tax=Streptomyces sp. NPDC005786 TaxID=3154891 RepID=UPI0033FF8A6B